MGRGSSSSSSAASVTSALARTSKAPTNERRHVVMDPVPEVRVIDVNNTGVQTEQTERFDLAEHDVATDDEVETVEVFDMGDRGRSVNVPDPSHSS